MKVGSAIYEMPSLRNNSKSYLMDRQVLHTETKHHVEVADNIEKYNPDNITAVVHELNRSIDSLRTNLKFEYHEQLNEYYVQVINPLTKEVIKEIPPKKMLDMYAAMAEFMGILVDEKI